MGRNIWLFNYKHSVNSNVFYSSASHEQSNLSFVFTRLDFKFLPKKDDPNHRLENALDAFYQMKDNPIILIATLGDYI